MKLLPSISSHRQPSPSDHRRRKGFTLIEILVASTIVLVLSGMLIQMTSITSRIWTGNKARIEQYQSARAGFEAMTRRLSQATLNTYWDYDKPAAASTAGAPPAKYIRQSELRFICGDTKTLVPSPTRALAAKGIFFHAPLGFIDRSKPDLRGMENLLNTWGYFVEFGSDQEYRPPVFTTAILPLRYRFRLMELMVPADSLTTYSLTSGLLGTTPLNLQYRANTWFSNFINLPVGSKIPRPVHVLADNIVGLTFVPKLSRSDEDRRGTGATPLCADYNYNTYYDPSKVYPDPEINPSNQLPPIVQVSMVALDEASAVRLADLNGTTMPVLGNGLFTNTRRLFDDPATPAPDDGDLAKLGAELAKQHLNYRVFTTDVTIRSAKWSREQK